MKKYANMTNKISLKFLILAIFIISTMTGCGEIDPVEIGLRSTAWNETIAKVQPITNMENNELPANRVYNGFWDFPYDKMSFADQEAYEFLKNAYAGIEWYSAFEKGDLTQYNFYIKNLENLLKMK